MLILNIAYCDTYRQRENCKGITDLDSMVSTIW